MDPKEAEFIGYVDILSDGCRIKNAFIRKWRTLGLESAIKLSAGFDEKQRKNLEDKARELGIF